MAGQILTRTSLVLAILMVGWFWYWTIFDPHVDVPAPTEVKVLADKGATADTVLFLGDLAPTDAAQPLLDAHGYGYPFEATRDLLHSHDFVVANLEAPVTTSDRPWPLVPKYVYKVHPDAIEGIRNAGIDAVTLSNNHMNDYGRKGLADTLAHLDEAGIYHAGAHMSEAGARQGLVIEMPGGRLGVISYMQDKLQWRMYNMLFALDAPFRTWAGVARFRRDDIGEDISRMRRHADVVAVVVHWGENYTPIEPRQEILGRACVDLGADAVIGHHPHWYQPVELYRGRPIIYSLGNYAFGTLGRRTMRFGMGAALHLENGKITAVEFIPLSTQNRVVRFRPHLPGGEALDSFFKGLVEGSLEMDATIHRRGDRGWLYLK